MRSFLDAAGRGWDAVLGKESYGTLVILFTARDGGQPRKAILAAETSLEATNELDALSDDEIRERLAGSVAWE
ncbi:MAG: hypothetical protein M3373_08840 [Gemmatimonadota bacterium]|nr:hypothetical protein [Gemmatimonadota bacterium]